jgi:hypothetical protein
VLQLWRDAARVADELPADDTVRTILLFEAAELRLLYSRLTAEAGATDAIVLASRDTIDDARAAIDTARLQLGLGDGICDGRDRDAGDGNGT